MSNKRIFILVPDGIGLRNFAYTLFNEIGNQKGFHITYWNNTPFDLQELGLNEIKIEKVKHHSLTEIYKNARKHIELNLFSKKFDDKTFDLYRFPFTTRTLKHRVKTNATKFLIAFKNSEKGLLGVREKIKRWERKTKLYKKSYETLKKEMPEMVFCTNQRPMAAIAPLLAAQDLKIPTATFIFSWDNLPKATMVVETDYYFVWSDFMKNELLEYYPYINESQVYVTGTPQFENHFDTHLMKSRVDFFNENGLAEDKRYLCFSGDDVTTSPDDPQYLNDFAQAVSDLNAEGYNLGIMFRRCPVDFSNRYDEVLNRFKEVITPIEPLWEKIGEGWNTVLPTKEDLVLQTNTILYSEFVVNLGSSMVFDYALHGKKCAYINYDVSNKLLESWSTDAIYKYIHFRSMPNPNAVIWFNNPEEIKEKIINILLDSEVNHSALEWSRTILGNRPEKASLQIWNAIEKILD